MNGKSILSVAWITPSRPSDKLPCSAWSLILTARKADISCAISTGHIMRYRHGGNAIKQAKDQLNNEDVSRWRCSRFGMSDAGSDILVRMWQVLAEISLHGDRSQRRASVKGTDRRKQRSNRSYKASPRCKSRFSTQRGGGVHRGAPARWLANQFVASSATFSKVAPGR